MGINWRRRSRQHQPIITPFALDLSTELAALWSSESELRVNRKEALSVPAVMRARNLIAGTLGTLPLHLHDVRHNQVPNGLLDQPEPDVPRSVTMTMTFEDLLFEGIAWWRVTRFAWTDYPADVERVHPSRVGVRPDGSVWIDGQRVPDTELIRFDSPNPALLVSAARAIRTCLRLDASASRYAAEPMPTGVFTPTEGADPASDAQIKAVLNDWKAARNASGTAYVPAALKYQPLQWSPADLQLADARNHAVLEIARATGVDPEDLGVSTTSRTYANAETRRLDLLDFTLGAYVNAVQDRLSMNDVTPRGYYARFKFDGFLRSDTLTRYTAYEKGLAVGALTQPEIRVLEDRPPAAAPKPVATPAPAVSADRPADLQLSRESGITFDAVHTAGQFKVDAHARTVTGLVVPYGPTARSGGGNWRFSQGSLKYSDLKRVKLLRDHDHGQALGVAIKATDTPDGMVATFKIGRGQAGDDALALAEDGVLDGFSVGVDFSEGGYSTDPDDPDIRVVNSAAWRETSLTAMPAFDSARVASVQAMREATMTTDIQDSPPAAPDHTAAFTAALENFTAVIGQLGSQREPVAAGKALGFQVSEPPVYTFTPGHGPSIVRDTFAARNHRDRDAETRLAKFDAQLTEFATVNRTVGAPVIPPGYRPDLYVPQLFQGRPLYTMLSKGPLSDATPFTLPRFGSATGGSADHVEGTNPSDGTLVMQSVTVTPGAISGRYRITREIIDASNPAIDVIAFAAMQESYSQQTEGKVYALLNGTGGVGGAITGGSVPSGAAAQAVTGVGSTGAAGVAMLDAVRDQLVAYPFRRFAAPNRLALSQEATTHLAKAKDTTGRPLLPRLGAMNASGTVSNLDQSFDIDGLAGVPTWSMTGNAAGDADAILFNAQDAWAWESSLMTFRYEEVAGPANIDLVLFGYFAVQVLRPSGFTGIRLTVT